MLNKTRAIQLLIILLSLVVIFHILILIKIIPYTIAWGGRLKSDLEMYQFEGVSILVNCLLIWILNLKKKQINHKIIDPILWIFFVIFILNTIGNLLAKTSFEKSFSILTLVFALLIFKILKKKKSLN